MSTNKPTIEIVIKNGKARVHTQGITGESCTAYTAGLLRRLGGDGAPVETQLTGEYFGEAGQTTAIGEQQQQLAS